MHAKFPCRDCTVVMKVGAAMFLIFGYSSLAQADADQIVERIAAPTGHIIWRITRPEIDQPTTQYSQIQFRAGQSVLVTASGCANAGGKGRTSTRYVDPTSVDSDLHHGQISIPGATRGLVSFIPTQPTQYQIPLDARLPPSAHLTLGYVDTDYKDNGYRPHDNGQSNQCRNVNDASVTVDISNQNSPGNAPATANYLFTIENITIRHLRSRNNDVLDLSAGVMVGGIASDVASMDAGKFRNGSHDVNIAVLVDSVAPTDRIKIAYSVLNSGYSTGQKTASLVTGVMAQIWQVVPAYGSLLGDVTNAIDSLLDIQNPDCDGPVVAGSVAATGQELFELTHMGPAYRRTLAFPGVDSSVGCGGNSYYEITYSIAPAGKVKQKSLMLRVNALTRSTTIGARGILLPYIAVAKEGR